MVSLLRDPALRDRVGTAARDSVREKFLLPRLAADYLRAAAELVSPGLLRNGNGHAHGVNKFADLEHLRP